MSNTAIGNPVTVDHLKDRSFLSCLPSLPSHAYVWSAKGNWKANQSLAHISPKTFSKFP